MDTFFPGAMKLLMERSPRHYTRLQVLNWMVRRFQMSPRTASR